MEAGPDKDVGGLVQLLGHLVRMDSFYGERDYPDTIGRFFRGIDLHSLDRLQTSDKAAGKVFPMMPDIFHTKGCEVVYSGAKTNAAGNIRGACLVLLVPFRRDIPALRYSLHHPAAEFERFQTRRLHPEDTGAGRAKHLVARERKKVAAEYGYIYRHMGNRLGTIDKEEDTAVMADPGMHPYFRYAPADSGISPLRFPPVKGEIIRVNSHVHDPDGITTEDPQVTREMADKRMKKMEGLARETGGMNPVNIRGVPDAATALLCWGSGKGVCEEVGRRKGLRVIQPVVLWPFPEKVFGHAMEGVEQFYAVETNESGQLAGLVSRFGFRPAGKILKYDGRPFMVNELDTLVDRVIP